MDSHQNSLTCAGSFIDQQHAVALEAARRQRAAAMRCSIGAATINLRRDQPVIFAAVSTLVGIAAIVAYGATLAGSSVAASLPALLMVLLAATLSSIAGFAFSAICGVMLLQVMHDPVQVVEIMMVCSIAIQSFSVTLLWRDIDWRRLGVFLIGAPAGLPVGVGLLLHLDPYVCRHVIGGLLTAYAAWILLKPNLRVRSVNPIVYVAIGFLGGITGGLAGFPGATVAAWCGLQGWDKRRQRGLYQPFILIMQVLALLLIQVMHPAGMRDASVSLTDLAFIPPALLGTLFGLTLFARLSDRYFAVTVNALLLVSGLGLLL